MLPLPRVACLDDRPRAVPIRRSHAFHLRTRGRVETMHLMKIFWRCFCFGFVPFFFSCKPSEHSDTTGRSASTQQTVSPAERKKVEARLKWNMATLVGDYEKKGTKSPKWDRDAKEALATFARARTYGPEQVAGFPTNLVTLVNSAIRAGCTDPLIKYFQARFALETTDTNEIASVLKEAYFDLLRSDYSPVRKFYSGIRAVEARYRISGLPRRENTDSIAGWNMFKAVREELHKFLIDKTAPVEEVDEACHEYLHLASRLTGDLDFVFRKTEPLLFANWSQHSFSYLLKGEVYILYAWAVRGSGTAEKVKPEGWQGFAERLAVGRSSAGGSLET